MSPPTGKQRHTPCVAGAARPAARLRAISRTHASDAAPMFGRDTISLPPVLPGVYLYGCRRNAGTRRDSLRRGDRTLAHAARLDSHATADTPLSRAVSRRPLL